jgi:hypothetical protein
MGSVVSRLDPSVVSRLDPSFVFARPVRVLTDGTLTLG